MAFDAGLLRCVLYEIQEKCLEGKVEKIYQPSKDRIDIIIHKGRENRKISINAGGNARIQLTEAVAENPIVAPVFCMLLRKHLSGGKLISAEQLDFERAAVLTFTAYDDMGFPCEKKIIAETMGKFSNIILTDGVGKILACAKSIDITTSTKRQVIPGLIYEAPPAQSKASPLDESEEHFAAKFKEFPPERTVDKFIFSSYCGISSAVALEIAYRACGDTETLCLNCDVKRLYSVFSDWFSSLKSKKVTPYIIKEADGKIRDYAYLEMTFLTGGAICESRSSFSEMLDEFFEKRDIADKIKSRGADILRLVSNAKGRLTRKIEIQSSELADCARGEEYKRNADLITANIYRLKKGDTEFFADNFYSENCEKIKIELNPRLTPAQNAQKMYKLYTKSKNAQKYLTEQLEIARRELEYIASVEAFLEKASTESELLEIRDELYSAGYASRMKQTASVRNKKTKPYEYTAPSGYKILCGRNNTQNDMLTFKTAAKNDLWFHVKGMPGSHVILFCNGEEPSELDYTQACEIAAYHSSASEMSSVEVDYTRVKNIKKPQGAKPGYVIYHTNYSANVMPKIPKGE